MDIKKNFIIVAMMLLISASCGGGAGQTLPLEFAPATATFANGACAAGLSAINVSGQTIILQLVQVHALGEPSGAEESLTIKGEGLTSLFGNAVVGSGEELRGDLELNFPELAADAQVDVTVLVVATGANGDTLLFAGALNCNA
jgi:hypothetical protein